MAGEYALQWLFVVLSSALLIHLNALTHSLEQGCGARLPHLKNDKCVVTNLTLSHLLCLLLCCIVSYGRIGECAYMLGLHDVPFCLFWLCLLLYSLVIASCCSVCVLCMP